MSAESLNQLGADERLPERDVAVPDKQTVRQFSKEQNPEERKKLAAELWAGRKEYFDKKRSHQEVFDGLIGSAKKNEIEVAEVVSRLQEIDEILRERKESRLKAIANVFNTPKLERERVELEGRGEEIAAAQQILQEQISERQRQIEDRTLLKGARKQLDDFYAGEERAWVEYQEAERARDVKNVIERYGAYVVHGIKDHFVPGENSMLRYGVDMETKLKVLLAFEPTLATSTIRSGDRPQNMWAREGALLTGGRVLSASQGDAATVATGIKQRTEGWGATSNIAENIRKAIEGRVVSRGGYNELVVENPQVVGLYVCRDYKEGDPRERSPVAVERIVALAQETGLPLYAISKGEVYEMTYDFDPESLKPRRDDFLKINLPPKPFKRIFLGRKISPSELAQKSVDISDAQRVECAREVLGSSPFRMKGWEAGYVSQRTEGSKMYVDLHPEALKEAPARYSEVYTGEPLYSQMEYSAGRSWGKPENIILDTGETVEVVSEVRAPDGSWQKVLRTAEGLFRQRFPSPHFGEDKSQSQPKTERFEGWEEGYAKSQLTGNFHLGLAGGAHDLGGPARKETYIGAVFAQVAYCNEQITELEILVKEKPYMESSLETYRQSINYIAYYLYGFGEEAEKFGDTQTRDKAWDRAAEIMPLDQIREVIQRRVNEKGGYRITREELE